MLRRAFLSTSAVAATGLALSRRARAQDAYPSKPVTIIVPFAAGGNTDAFARIVGQELDKAFDQRFVVDNKAGAGGNLGVGQLARSEPDGYTLGMGTVSTHAINPTLYKNLPYDPDTAFAPISLFVTLPNVLAVNPEIPAETVPELIELLKAEPDTYTFASSGVGTSTHLAGELFMAKTGTRINHVPYKSSGQVILDVIAGHVDMAFDNIPLVAQQASAGKLRPLAVTSLDRAALLPDVPPMADFVPGFEATSWHGLFAPAGTPQAIVDRLSAEVRRILHSEAIGQQLVGMGAKPIGNEPNEFVQFIAAERQKWAEVIESANISIDS
ncbi:MAG TPA: tripartite tricarboxylate transporter substrate binding protein [Geminicoccaceae bacterium]|nr:tripartite tricarboxylate transporter substrate binding protein [Geminicoccus sp.]HMU52787.1 tripartite tricarboxylate transporter substrate binding protein [Geminicoccaceae bacterium]